MIISVTGASGHVGVNLCKSLTGNGHEVRALIHQNERFLEDIPVRKYYGDLLDPSTLEDFVRGAEIVIHLAAKISITGDPDGTVYRLNTEGPRNMTGLALKHNVRRFIHFSSIHAISQFPHDEPLDETRPLVNDKAFAYDRSKAEGERIVLQSVKKGLDAFVLSPTAIIGPMDPEPGLMGQAFLQIFHGKIPALVPGGYDMVDVRDIVDTVIASIDRGKTGEKYLLSNTWHSIGEISALISEFTSVKTVRTEMPFWTAKVGLPFITVYSKLTRTVPLYTSESLSIIMHAHRKIRNDKAARELGFAPRDIRESIRDIFDWFDQNGYLNKQQ